MTNKEKFDALASTISNALDCCTRNLCEGCAYADSEDSCSKSLQNDIDVLIELLEIIKPNAYNAQIGYEKYRRKVKVRKIKNG